MKHLTIFLLTALIISCKPSTKESVDESENSFNIDTVLVPGIELNNICVNIDTSIYPKISGMKDEVFQKQLNEIFYNNFNSVIDSVKSQEAGCITGEDEEGKILTNLSATVGCWFEVLNNGDSILSILQSSIRFPQGGGNGYELSYFVTNCDIKNRRILTNADFNIGTDKINLLNSKIKSHLDREFPENKDVMNYPEFENKAELNKLTFGVSKDSIILITEAYPSAHYTHRVYVIPFEKRSGR